MRLRKNCYLGCIVFALFAPLCSTVGGAINASWNSTSGTLTVTYTSPEVAQFTNDSSGNVLILQNGSTPIQIYESGYTVSVSTSSVANLVVNGSSGGDWFDCAAVTAANGWGSLSTAKFYGNGGGDDINGTGIADLIFGGTGSDLVDGNGGDDVLADWELGESFQSCSSVLINHNSQTEELHVSPVAGSDGFASLAVTEDTSHLKISLNGYELQTIAKSEVREMVLEGTPFDDTIDCSGVSQPYNNVAIYGMAGGDVIKGSDTGDYILGGPGPDSIQGNGGNDALADWELGESFQSCSSVIIAHNSQTEQLYISPVAGSDRLASLEVTEDSSYLKISLNGYELQTISKTLVRAMVVVGTPLDDSIDCSGVSQPYDNVVIYGMAGSDVIKGSDTADYILGGPGNDDIDGGLGYDFVDDYEAVDTIDDCVARLFHFDPIAKPGNSPSSGHNIKSVADAAVSGTGFVDTRQPGDPIVTKLHPNTTTWNPSITPGSSMKINGVLISAGSTPTISQIVADINGNATLGGDVTASIVSEVINSTLHERIALNSTTHDIVLEPGVLNGSVETWQLLTDLGLPDSGTFVNDDSRFFHYGPRRRKAFPNSSANSFDLPGPTGYIPGTNSQASLGFPAGYCVPEVLSNGVLDCWLRGPGAYSGEKHSMMSVRSQVFPHDLYLKQLVHYRLELEVEINSHVADTGWTLIGQVFPAKKPSNWNGGTNVTLGLYCEKDLQGVSRWLLALRGAPAGATAYASGDDLKILAPFSFPVVAGTYSVVLDFKFDSETSTGFAKCTIDRHGDGLGPITLADETNKRIGFPLADVAGNVAILNSVPPGQQLLAGYATIGNYGSLVPVSDADKPHVYVRRVELYLDEE